MSKKTKLERRQYKYIVGSFIKFTRKRAWWMYYNKIYPGDLGEVIKIGKRKEEYVFNKKTHTYDKTSWIDNNYLLIRHIETGYEKWIRKGYGMTLITNGEKIMESL